MKHLRTPKRLSFASGEWALEIESYRPLGPGMYRPVRHTVIGAESILGQLSGVLRCDTLARSAQQLMSAPPPSDETRLYEVQGEQWGVVSSADGASGSSVSSGGGLSEEAAVKLSILEDRLGRLEGALDRLAGLEASLAKLAERPPAPDPPPPVAPEPPSPEPPPMVEPSAAEPMVEAEEPEIAPVAPEPVALAEPPPAAAPEGAASSPHGRPLIDATVNAWLATLNVELEASEGLSLADMSGQPMFTSIRVMGQWEGSVAMIYPTALAMAVARTVLDGDEDDEDVLETANDLMNEMLEGVGKSAVEIVPPTSYPGSPAVNRKDTETITQLYRDAHDIRGFRWKGHGVLIVVGSEGVAASGQLPASLPDPGTPAPAAAEPVAAKPAAAKPAAAQPVAAPEPTSPAEPAASSTVAGGYDLTKLVDVVGTKWQAILHVAMEKSDSTTLADLGAGPLISSAQVMGEWNGTIAMAYPAAMTRQVAATAMELDDEDDEDIEECAGELLSEIVENFGKAAAEAVPGTAYLGPMKVSAKGGDLFEQLSTSAQIKAGFVWNGQPLVVMVRGE